MYTNYLGRELYNKLDKLVSKAFHYIYLPSSENSYGILEIKLDYCFMDEDDNIPIVEILVGCTTKFDGNFNVKLDYNLNYSDEFNIGRFTKTIEDYLDRED